MMLGHYISHWNSLPSRAYGNVSWNSEEMAANSWTKYSLPCHGNCSFKSSTAARSGDIPVVLSDSRIPLIILKGCSSGIQQN
jgi:hypothetical protein